MDKKAADKKPIKIVIKSESCGSQSVSDALIPIVFEGISKAISQNRTLDKRKKIS